MVGVRVRDGFRFGVRVGDAVGVGVGAGAGVGVGGGVRTASRVRIRIRVRVGVRVRVMVKVGVGVRVRVTRARDDHSRSVVRHDVARVHHSLARQRVELPNKEGGPR